MANPEIFIISILRGLTEVALLALLGQGLLALLAGSRRATNPIYQLFQTVTRPVLRIARFITPRAIIDKHLPFVAFFLLFWLWIFLAYAKRVLGDVGVLT
ncbi:hypothetical protein RHDC2_00726 [Rhodocyclaceae bacterium]|nr:hypothetical protein RHDC2_00726 [Rhodocyclaceae bacterium]